MMANGKCLCCVNDYFSAQCSVIMVTLITMIMMSSSFTWVDNHLNPDDDEDDNDEDEMMPMTMTMII